MKFSDIFNEELNEKVQGLDEFYKKVNQLHNEFDKLSTIFEKEIDNVSDNSKKKKVQSAEKKIQSQWLEFVKTINAL